MRLTLARSMAHTLSCNTPVKKSTGRFGALQVGKVLSSGEANREKRDWKGLWESLLLTRSLSFFFPDMMANTKGVHYEWTRSSSTRKIRKVDPHHRMDEPAWLWRR